ncbi:MAG: hypothetical protein EOP61_04115 [Sphingomonadales bacterium]|nr:MAG: hypothetical protein EOP61_04115 [Sphingomonadales bacterium]
MNRQTQGGKAWRRAALLLLACALLLKFPAGWMPEARAGGISMGWCNAVSPEAQSEGKALLEKALADRSSPKQKHASDQPCTFAAAAQPLAAADPQPELAPVATPAPVFVAALAAMPGRGLAAPPPLSTGPPLLA